MPRYYSSSLQILLIVEIIIVLAISGLGCSTHISVPITPAFTMTPAVTPTSSSSTSQLTPSSFLGQATFTGKFKDFGLDTNNDGKFEFLQVDIELKVTQAGGFGFTTGLLDSVGRLIATGSLSTDTLHNAPVSGSNLQPGLQLISIYFLGSNIRSSHTDGPYSIGITLADEAGNIVDISSLTTKAYNYQMFERNAP